MSEKQPIRAVFCHFTADVCGGSDRSLFDLVTHLPRDRFSPTVILCSGDPLAARYREAGVPVIERTFVAPRRAVEPLKLARYFLNFFPAALGVARVLRRLRADVAHVNTLFNLQGAVGARLARCPLVWHVRELVPDSRAARIMLWLVKRLAARPVANSTAVSDALRDSGALPCLVLNGIDASEYEMLPDGTALRQELGLKPEDRVVATIGRIEPWKGQHVFIEAAARVLAVHGDVRFLVVGGPAANKPAYLDGLRARCAALGIADHVLFTGIRADIPQVLAASEMLVLPSITPEPFGRTVVEAMLAARPVIATDAGGPRDTVVDGETGCLVPPEDAAALAARINALLDDPALARTMGARGRERALAHFTLDRVVREMAQVLEHAAATARR